MAFIGRSPVRASPAVPSPFLERKATPLRVMATPATGPSEAMVASLQAHIDELVQKSRNFEHEIKRLKQNLADEKERNTEIAVRFRTKSAEEREDLWGECLSLLAAHRIVHLRTRNELAKEQIRLAQESENGRKERLAILLRDYKLTLFQRKELDSDSRISELEEEIEDLKERSRDDEEDYQTLASAFEQEMTKAISGRQAALNALKTTKSELVNAQAESSRLSKESTSLKVTTDTNSNKVERLTLQLDGAKATVSELEGTITELKRANADLKRQLKKWESLENKSDVEVGEERKRRMELEVEATNLEKKVAELEKGFNLKVARLEEDNEKMAEVADEAQAIARSAQEDCDRLQKQLDAAERLAEDLRRKADRTNGDDSVGEEEIEVDEPPKARQSRKAAPKPASAKDKPKTNKGKAKALPEEKALAPKESDSGEGSSDEEIIKPARGQPSAKKRKNRSPALSDDQAQDPPPVTERRSKAPAKIKPARDNAGDDDTTEQTQKRTKSKENKPPKPSQEKEKSKKPPASQEPRIKEDEPETHPKRKKKKLFPTTQDTFPWDSLPKGDGTLNIPTSLSPVKDNEAVPARSMFGRMGAAIGLR